MIKALPLLAPLLIVTVVGCGKADPLKNDAFAYYGLGNTNPMRLQIVQGEGGFPTPATRTVIPGKREGNKQSFTLKNEGGTENEGDIALSLEPDGVYAMSSTKNKIVAHSVELPGKLDVGTVWKDHTQMIDQKIDLQNELKVVGRERVSTAGGTFDDALHVKSTGSGTYRGEPASLETESWYVKDLGPVKQIVVVAPKKGAKQTVTIELAAPEKAPEAGGDPSMGAPGGAMPGGAVPGGAMPPTRDPGMSAPTPPAAGGKK